MATCTITPGGKAGYGPQTDGSYAGRVLSLMVDPEQMRLPEYMVYVHSISQRDFHQPNPVFNDVYLRACPKDKRSMIVWAKSHPIGIPTLDPDNVSGPPKMVYVNAKGLALSICNPSYLGNDLAVQERDITDWANISSKECNLTRQGLFVSLNEVPTEDELKKAEARRVAYYKFCFKEANGIAQSEPAKLQDILTIDHHLAAEMFGEDVSWHRVVSPKVDCQQCGEKIKKGLAFHFINGRPCILDWEKAYLAGAIKKEDVPEGREWWTVDKPKRKTGISAAAEELRQADV